MRMIFASKSSAALALAFASAMWGTHSRVSAQTLGVVVPRHASYTEGNRYIWSILRESYGRRVQLVIGSSHLTALQGKRIFEIAFRKDLSKPMMYSYLRAAVDAKMRILASFSDADPREPSLVFGSNHDAAVEVFRGTVRAPLVSDTDARRLASFSSSEAPTIAFDKAIPHVPGKSLVLTFITEGGAMGYPWIWPVDADTNFQAGTVTPIGQSCWDASKRAKVIDGSLRPGMHIKTTSATPPDPVAAFVLIGASDKVAFGSLPLPILIAPPSCQLYVSPDIMLPGLFHRGGSDRIDGVSGATIATPYLASLFGSEIFLQHFFLHYESSQLRVRTSNAIRATFTRATPSLDASMVASLDKDATHGRVFLDFIPVLRILAK